MTNNMNQLSNINKTMELEAGLCHSAQIGFQQKITLIIICLRVRRVPQIQ